MTTFFQTGLTYNVHLKSGAIRKFKCTGIDQDKLIVKGSYENGKEKGYRAEPSWKTLADKQEGKEPSEYIIKINNTIGTLCSSKHYEK
jgi:hypothetical protein